jgi:hypothetical protein
MASLLLFVAGLSAFLGLDTGQGLAKPSLPGFSSNSSEHGGVASPERLIQFAPKLVF